MPVAASAARWPADCCWGQRGLRTERVVASGGCGKQCGPAVLARQSATRSSDRGGACSRCSGFLLIMFPRRPLFCHSCALVCWQLSRPVVSLSQCMDANVTCAPFAALTTRRSSARLSGLEKETNTATMDWRTPKMAPRAEHNGAPGRIRVRQPSIV